MKTLAVVAMVVIAVLGAGCGKSEKTYQTPGGEVKVKKDGGEVTYQATGKDGQQVTVAAGEKGIALPADFPKDVPILKGSIVKVAMTQGKQTVVHLYGTMPVADAAKFYNEELKSQGWEIQSTLNTGEMNMVSAKKGKTLCSVTVAKESDGTLVQLAISQEGA